MDLDFIALLNLCSEPDSNAKSITVGESLFSDSVKQHDTPTDTPKPNQSRGSDSRSTDCLCPTTGRYRTLVELATGRRFSKCLILRAPSPLLKPGGQRGTVARPLSRIFKFAK